MSNTRGMIASRPTRVTPQGSGQFIIHQEITQGPQHLVGRSIAMYVGGQLFRQMLEALNEGKYVFLTVSDKKEVDS